MAAKRELLRRGYDAFHVGDYARAMEEFADDIRWEMPRAHGLPASGFFHGKDEVRWMFEQIRDAYGDEMSGRPVEFIESSAAVVVLGHLEGRPNGNHFRVPYVTIWRFNETGQAQHALTLFDTAVVRDALTREPRDGPPGRTRVL